MLEYNEARPYEAYQAILKEYFDINDNDTREVMLNIDEAEQGTALMSLASKLYDDIVKRVDEIDFGEIPNTKGDVTKLPNYLQIRECCNTINGILTEFKQDTEPVDRIIGTLDRLEARKNIFERSYKFNVEFNIMIYSTIYLAAISSLSLLISTSIDFIKLPSDDTFKASLDRVGLAKSKNNLLFTNLLKFNKLCDKGELDNILITMINNNSRVKREMAEIVAVDELGGVPLSTIPTYIKIASSIVLIIAILPILRWLIFYYYHCRTKFADYCDNIANLLQINSYNIETNASLDSTRKEEIIQKQTKYVDFFRKLSNMVMVKDKQAEVKANREIITDNKKYKADDVFTDGLPDSAIANKSKSIDDILF